ncbi:MAG: C4-dicarboxylate ABC transporter, partial [Caenispirillum bisanense]|nr:C4-dicarboxylate ABC transporter [Caenispirillum bisanense]
AAGRAWDTAEAPARQAAVDAGHTVVRLDATERAAWQEATRPVIDRWTERVEGGAALYEEARALVAG